MHRVAETTFFFKTGHTNLALVSFFCFPKEGMPLTESIIIVIGLMLFEIISSIDNAVVNADVLSTMSERGRKWFLLYGILSAVFIVRGVLPLLILYLANPGIGIIGTFTATFSGDASVHQAIEATKPLLLSGGGVYLLFLFFHWLFLEKKEYAFFLEEHIHQKLYLWFYSIVSLILLGLVFFALKSTPAIALGSVIGSTAFFITNGFKTNAEAREKEVMQQHLSDVSKIFYLEIIDLTFSIDGVLGAFAFTLSIPLILIGNGLGAFVLRYLTIRGIETVRKYRYLKNGAMYSIGLLGLIMITESFHIELAAWLPPLTTASVVGLFFWLSRREIQIEEKLERAEP